MTELPELSQDYIRLMGDPGMEPLCDTIVLLTGATAKKLFVVYATVEISDRWGKGAKAYRDKRLVTAYDATQAEYRYLSCWEKLEQYWEGAMSFRVSSVVVRDTVQGVMDDAVQCVMDNAAQ